MTGSTERRDRIDLVGGGVLIGFSILMGFNQPLIKLVNEGFQPVFQAGLRSLCAFPLIFAYALLRRRRLSFNGATLWPGVLIGVFFAAEFLLMFSAVELTSVSRVSVLLYTMPFWVALGAHFLIPTEKLTRRRVFGLTVAVIGVAFAFSEKSVDAGPRQLLGDVMCLAAAMFWAGIALVARLSSLTRTTPETQLLYQLGVSAVLLVAVAPLFGAPVREPTPAIAAIFAFQVVAVVGVGFLSWFWALSVYPSSDMAAFSFLSPVFGVAFSALILGETISAAFLGSLVLVGIGIFLVNWKPKSKPAPAPAA